MAILAGAELALKGCSCSMNSIAGNLYSVRRTIIIKIEVPGKNRVTPVI